MFTVVSGAVDAGVLSVPRLVLLLNVSRDEPSGTFQRCASVPPDAARARLSVSVEEPPIPSSALYRPKFHCWWFDVCTGIVVVVSVRSAGGGAAPAAVAPRTNPESA